MKNVKCQKPQIICLQQLLKKAIGEETQKQTSYYLPVTRNEKENVLYRGKTKHIRLNPFCSPKFTSGVMSIVQLSCTFCRSGSHRGATINNEYIDRAETVQEVGGHSTVDPSKAPSAHGSLHSAHKRHTRADSYSFSFRGHSRQVF